MISPSKSSCVHFFRKRNLHPDPFIHIGNLQIPVVSEMRFLGVILDSKLTFLPHVLYLRKKCERSLNILKVLSNTLWGADRVSFLRVYQALIRSRLDYGCVVYGSARASVLKRLDTIHHSALRICSGAFRTSPVTSLYVVCHQPPLELRRRQLSANYFIRAMSVPSHPLKPFALAIGLNRLYEARSFNIKPFSERAKAVLNDAHLSNISIQENNILLLFLPRTSKFLIIVTLFQAMTKQALRKLFISSSFLSIAADNAARSMSDLMQKPVCCQDLKTSIQHYVHHIWQETWDQQILNKLHSIHPSTSHWAALPVRRHDVRLTRLRIGHTRFTHRHLLLGENAPECPLCKLPYSVYHILIDCPVFNHHRITFFHTSVLALSDLVGETPHQKLFAFLLKIGFLHMI
ncbi:putative RNA-directed DNA polymerase from transposon BS [Trichonephila clavipes]|nr:putative RNA-directed DNA polymerase from transposon BS [Trichonephila clavipes]